MLRAINLVASSTYEEARASPAFRAISNSSGYPARVIYDRIRNVIRHEVLQEDDLLSQNQSPELVRLHELIDKYFHYHVIYLPTYRRIEQDLKSVLNVEAEPAELSGFIHFGMRDITQKIEKVTGKIRDHFVLSYGTISGQMLGQLTENIEITAQMRTALSNKQEVEIVLSRVGQNISPEIRTKILSMIGDGTITQNAHLSFLSRNLL